MSSTEDDDFMIKLDANIEVETIVRNRFEEYEDLCYNDPFSNHYSVSSDEEQVETSVESSQASEYRDLDNVASVGSDVSENYTSAVSDVSAESTDSMAVDVALHEVMKEQAATSKFESNFLESRVKYVNCKELIVFCIDMSSDMEKVPYIITDEFDDRSIKSNYSKGGSGPFMHQSGEPASSRITNQTKHSPLNMICEFTNSPSQLIDAMEDLTETVECNSCDLSSIISLLTEKYPFILSAEFHPADVHRILRVILVYGRANCNVKFSNQSAKEILMDNPSLFLDIVYIHESPSEENKCKEIYEALCSLDDKEKSYIFETTRSVTTLHNIMGRLLSHPFQRVSQKNANYRLQDIVPQDQHRRC